MHLYDKQFDEQLHIERAGNPPAPPTRTIVIASTPRSGSHMLGHIMAATNAMGVPFEYANPANLAEWKRIFGTQDTIAVMNKLMEMRTTENGVFTIKLHYSHVRELGGYDRIFDIFPNPCFIKIVRGDVLRQAISMTIAQQTGVWISGQQGNGEQASYDYEQICRNLRDIAIQVANWETGIRARNALAMTLDYSQVLGNVGKTVQEIADFAGIATYDPVDAPKTKKQSTSSADEWITRFVEDHGRGGNPLKRKLSKMLKGN